MMKIIGKGAIRNEKGSVLPLVLVLLVLGGLILTPLLGLMGTGLMSGQVYEKKTEELYAADAGVEDAVWKIMNDVDELPASSCGNESWSYNYSIFAPGVNGKNVTVTIDYSGNYTHLVRSTATSNDGSSTTVESYVEFVPGIDLNIQGGALVSRTDLTLVKNLNVTGDVYYCGDKTEGSNVVINGTVHDDICPVPFPTPDEDKELAQALRDRAMGGEPPHEDDMVHIDDDGNVVIDKEGSVTWGPTYIAGNLTIGDDATVTWGPTYIAGDLTIGARTTITLGGILYVEGWINWRDDCYHGDKAITITGTGSIVAGGDICFGSLADYTLTGDSIIMSLNGDIVLEKETEGDEIHAFVYAPNGFIDILKHFSVLGSVVGNSISVQASSYTYVPIGESDFLNSLIGGLETLTYTINP
jgi:hypothetical protein